MGGGGKSRKEEFIPLPPIPDRPKAKADILIA